LEATISYRSHTTDEDIIDWLDLLNERYAITDLGSIRRDTYVIQFGDGGEVVCARDFASFRRHLYQEPDVLLNNKSTPLAEAWLSSPAVRKYQGLVFAPPGSEWVPQHDEYNTWRGLAVEPAEGNWGWNRYHIDEVVCGDNVEYARWLHNWIAAMLQQPGRHGWVAPLLKGGQGIGKGYFADQRLGGMFRKHNYAHLTIADHLTSDFNSHLEDRVLVFADEAVWGSARAANKLKGLITETDVLINKKHVPQEIQQSALHIVIASNHEQPVNVERDDRRLFILQVAEHFKQDQKYFNLLRAELRDGGRAAMLHYFLNFEVDWDLLRVPPETVAKLQMKAASLSPEDDWWREVLENADSASWAKFCTKVGRTFLVERYSEWFDTFARGRYGKKNAAGLGSHFARHFKAGRMPGWPMDAGKVERPHGDQRDNAWAFPSLAECRAVFDRAPGTRNPGPRMARTTKLRHRPRSR
jgi:hypothetical protein